MLRTLRRNYRRMAAFLLTIAMTFTNVGANLNVAFAAGEDESALFLLSGSDLRDAIQDAMESGDTFDFSSLSLKAKSKSLLKSYQELIGGKKGDVYELDADIDDSYAPEGTELQVFYNSGTGNVIFLFINETDMVVTFRANVDGYETDRVTINPNAANVESEDETPAYVEDYSDTTMIDDVPQTLGAEVLGTNGSEETTEEETTEEEATEEETTEEEAAEGETTEAENAEAEVTESESTEEIVEGTMAVETEEMTTEAETTEEADTGEETGTVAEEENEAVTEPEAETGSEAETEAPTETEPETETEAPMETEPETEAEVEPGTEPEISEQVGFSVHRVQLVATNVEIPGSDILETEEPEIKDKAIVEVSATEEPEPEEETTTAADETLPSVNETDETTAAETEESADPTEENSTEESSTKESFTEESSTEESSTEESSTEESSEMEETSEAMEETSEAIEETSEAIEDEETSAEVDETEIEETIADATEGAAPETDEMIPEETTGSGANNETGGGSTDSIIREEGQLLEDDINGGIQFSGDLNGKAYNTVTIWDSANARAYRVALEDIQGEEAAEGIYQVDYSVDPVGTADIDGADSVREGENLYFGVTPQIGYEITGVTANGMDLEAADVAVTASASNLEDYEYIYVVEEADEDLEVVVSLTETEGMTHPEFNASYEASDGMVITLHAEEGILPEGTKLSVEEVTETFIEVVREKLESEAAEEKTVTSVVAYDINLMLNGRKLSNSWSKNGYVDVIFSGRKMEEMTAEADTVEIMAADDTSSAKLDAEGATDVTVDTLILEQEKEIDVAGETADEVSFEAAHFTIYAAAASKAAVKAVGDYTVTVGGTLKLEGTNNGFYHSWNSDNTKAVTVSGNGATGTVTGIAATTKSVTITHSYYWKGWRSETFSVTVTDVSTRRVYVYVKLDTASGVDTTGWNINAQGWYTIGYVDIATANIPSAAGYDVETYVPAYRNTVVNALNNIHYFSGNQNVAQGINLSKVDWSASGYGLKVADGASSYGEEAPSGTKQWHLDGLVTIDTIGKHKVTIEYIYEDKSTAAPTVTEEAYTGNEVIVNSPVITGYTPDQAVVKVTVLKDDIKVTVTYYENFPADKIVITANSKEKTYDGSPLTDAGYTYTEGILKEGDVLSAVVTGSQTNVGSSANVVTSYKVMRGETDVTSKYTFEESVDGTLTITALSVTFTGESATRTYTGQIQTLTGITPNGLLTDHTCENLHYAATGQNVGKYGGTFTGTAVIRDKAGNNVTENYTVKKIPGELTITAASIPVEFTGESGTRTYNGQIQTLSGITAEGLLEGHTCEGLTYAAAGQNTGEYNGAFTGTVVIHDAAGTDVTENYTVTKTPGRLTITAASIPVEFTGESATRSYTGQIITLTGITPTGLLTGHTCEGLTYAAAGQNTGEYNGSFTGTAVIRDAAGRDVTENYAVTKTPGKLTIINAEFEVEFTGESGTKTYNGQIQSLTGITAEGLLPGHSYENLTYAAAGQNTGEYNGAFSGSVVIRDAVGMDVTGNYAVTKTPGKLTITNAEFAVEFTGESGTRTYNGRPQTLSGITVEGLLEDHTFEDLTYAATGQNTGEYVGAFAGNVVIRDAAGTDVTENYAVTKTPGKLTITNAEFAVEFTGESGTKTYNGQTRILTGITPTGLLTGHTYEDLTYAATGRNAGEYDGVFAGTAVIRDADGTDVTENYKVTTTPGKLTINPIAAEIMVTADDAEKIFDGKALTNGGFVYTGDLPDGFSLEAVMTDDSAIIDVGEQPNVIKTVIVRDADYQDATKNFTNIKTENGILTVTPRLLTIVAESRAKKYDGFPLTWDGWYAEAATEDTGLAAGDAVVQVTVTGFQILAGSSPNVPGDAVITNGSGTTDGARNYEIIYKNGVLRVTDGSEDDPLDPELVVKKTHDDREYALGETVTFTITVTNIYDSPRTVLVSERDDVTLAGANPNTGDLIFENMQPGETKTVTATYVITEADILEGIFVNIVTVTFIDGKTFEEIDEVDPEKPRPQITVKKETTSTPANGTAYVSGETITYRIVATNTGNLTWVDVAVIDPLTGLREVIPGEFKPGDVSEVFTTSFVVTEKEVSEGKVHNEATAEGWYPDVPVDPENPTIIPGTTDDPTQTFSPSLYVDKQAENREAGYYGAGAAVNYSIRVLNNGNAVITDITVTDDLTGQTWTIPSLAPQAEQTFTATYTVTETDLVNGTIENTAVAVGKDPTGNPVTGQDTETIKPAAANGHLTIIKTTTSTPANGRYYRIGETITYSIRATNDGNLTLTNVVVTDELTGNTGTNAWAIARLAPGASQTFTASYVVTRADVSARKVVNVATGTGTSPDKNQPDVPVTPGTVEDTTGTSSSGGGGGGGGSSSGPRINTTTTSGGPGAATTIDPEQVPLAALPIDSEPGTAVIEEEDVPLAALPKTGQTSANALMLLISGMILAALAVTGRKKEEDQ